MVQGVGFRYSMRSRAQAIGVTGWVRNRADGTVEAVVVGTQAQFNEIFKWAEKGPDGCSVDSVDVFEGSGNFVDFSIRSTL